MAIVVKNIEPRTEIPTLRVVYRLPNGTLGPKNRRGEITDTLPLYSRSLDAAKSHAQWIVDGTLWSQEAHVQERQPEGKWKSIYVYEDY